MKILIAMDSFKGSIESKELNHIISNRIQKEIKNVNVEKIPISDGGEGFLDSLLSLDSYELKETRGKNPLGEEVKTSYLIGKNNTAVIESAKIIGLGTIDRLSPLQATSYGLGEVIIDAIENGAHEIIIGLGGSATNDGGIGILKALGYRFYDKCHNLIDVSIDNINKVDYIRDDQVIFDLTNLSFKAVTDVKNPFTGETGATNIYGKQKGLSEDDLSYVEDQMETLRKLVDRKMNKDLNKIEGSGAAGGISGIMNAFLGSEIVPGIEFILDSVDFDSHCKNTDLIITGEGRIDNQSFYGKVIKGVFDKAKLHGIPVIALGGSIETEQLDSNSDSPIIFSILNKPVTLEEAMDYESTKKNIDFTVKNICELIKNL